MGRQKNNGKREVKELWLGVRTRNKYEDCQKFGIYAIINTQSNKLYIGSTTASFQARWSAHSYQFRTGTHANRFMQKAFDEHGGDIFEYHIVEITNKKHNIFQTEQSYMDDYNTVYPNGYNIQPIAGKWGRNKNTEVNKRKTRRKSREPSSVYSDGGKNNFIRPYLRLNDMANNKIRMELAAYNFTYGDIDIILSNGIDIILNVYRDLCKTDVEYDRIFGYCLRNLEYERPTDYKSNRSTNELRDLCSDCSYFAGNDIDNDYDYCHHYRVHLPPINIEHCVSYGYGLKPDEVNLMRMFGRNNIDEIIEDYLSGKDYSDKEGGYHR